MLKDVFFTQPKKSVDSVMAAFSQTLSELDEVQAREEAEAQYQKQLAAQADIAAHAALQEAGRARSVSLKLRELISA